MGFAGGFYVTGGTLRPDAPSYVERRADRELMEYLRRGEFCYVLTSRQMGKSSLMVRTALKLRAEGIQVVALDLTALGQNLTPEQWYDGLLVRMGQQLGVEAELESFWLTHQRWSPVQRFFAAMREIVLRSSAESLVVFVDEIDTVRSLPFSTDEFFAAIRECYNRRAEEEAWRRVSFCLLGVATPTDLIRDTRTTPFNIGRRIELEDFQLEEAEALARGLARGESAAQAEGSRAGGGTSGAAEGMVENPGASSTAALAAARACLHRVHYWTGGHPYLTQRLCQALTERRQRPATPPPSAPDLDQVDAVCHALFFDRRAQERDDNLIFVRERILRGDGDLAAVLELCGRIWQGKRVPDDATNPVVTQLRLAGLARSVAGRLRVRNRIYARVFDGDWIRSHLPDAERRRQQRAFRQGLVRAGLVAVLILAVVGSLAAYALRQARRATEAKELAQREGYFANMALARFYVENNQFDRAQRILLEQSPEAYRGWEWGRLEALCQLDQMTLRGHTGEILTLAFSPDGRYLATGGEDQTIKVWDLVAGTEPRTIAAQRGVIHSIAYSPDGRRLAGAGADGRVTLWDTAQGQWQTTLTGHTGAVYAVAFSPDGRSLATGGFDKTARLWPLDPPGETRVLSGHQDSVIALAFSPDGTQLATAGGSTVQAVVSSDDSIRIWELASGREIRQLAGHTSSVYALAFSPNGRRLASGGYDRTARLWDLSHGQEIRRLGGGIDFVISVAFTPDGRRLAIGSWDKRARLFDVETGRLLQVFNGHSGAVRAVLSPDGRRLATGGADQTVKLWEVGMQNETLVLAGHEQAVWALAFSPDGRRLASGGWDKAVRIWDLEKGNPPLTLAVNFPALSLAFAPDGRRLVTVEGNAAVQVWDAEDGRREMRLTGHTSTVLAVDWSADGRHIASAGKDRTIRIWEARTGLPVHTLVGHTDWILGVAFSQDGQRLVSGGFDRTARVWDLASGRERLSLAGHEDIVLGVAFSPDGHLVATGSRDKTARLWDAESGRLRHILEGHLDGVKTVTFNPQGRRLATAGGGLTVYYPVTRDFSAKIWDVASGRELLTLERHVHAVFGVAFSADGRRLATASLDKTVRVWDALPWRTEDYPAVPSGQLADRLEHYKRTFWPQRRNALSFLEQWNINQPPLPREKVRPTLPVPPRDPNTPAACLDLSAHYNAALGEGFHPVFYLTTLDNNLASLPVGAQTLEGVVFDLRGLIQLRRLAPDWTVFPPRVTGLPVDRKCARLHFLQGAGYAARPGTPIGSYIAHYQDGRRQEIEIVYGRDVRDWWVASDPVAQTERARIAWTGTNLATEAAGGSLRLYLMTWENPWPDAAIESLDFVSHLSTSGPFLVAVTAE